MGKGILAVVVIAVIGFVAVRFMGGSDEKKMADTKKEPAKATDTKTAEKAKETTTGSTSEVSGKTVSTVETYKNPAGDDKVGFTLMIDTNGVITDAKTEVMAESDISKKLQGMFAAGFSEAVKGKKLSELTKIDRVGGASLTTGAFNMAIAKLQAQM